MTYKIWLRYEPCMLKIVVRTNSPENIVLKVLDPTQANTFFTDRSKQINGEQELFVRMPLAPSTASIVIYNEKNGNLPAGQDNSFKVVSIKKEELDITLPKTKMNTFSVRNFVSFAQKFAYNAGWYTTPRDFMSSVGSYKIEYLPFIINSKGEKMSTPARISTKNGRIQVSAESFRDFTIPMRMAILLHEFSHFNLNVVQKDEIEADLNALKIYLGLGYPVIEAHNSFLNVFKGTPSQQNKERYQYIKSFIDNFEELKFRICI